MEIPIYLDYNATTPIDREVAQEMKQFIDSHFGNPSSSYTIGRFNKDAIRLARNQVADLINANPDEILFTSCATESNNLAIWGVLKGKQGKHIITSAIEHPAIIEVCRHLETQGYEITYIPVDKFGSVNPQDVENAIRPDTSLITIMHANNEVGTIQPISEIAAIAKKHKVIFHTDAAQSVGKIETDVSKLGVDLLTIAGHKLYAPKGIGALYVKNGVEIQNIMFGANQEKGIRPGTENVIHIVALGKACEIAKRDFDKNSQNMLSMRDSLLNGLKKNLGEQVKVNVNLQKCLPNTLSVAFDKVDAHTLASVISKDICISTGSACHADSIEISSVLKAMNINIKTAAGTVRISTGKYTTSDEIDSTIEIISKTILKLNH
ncbi:MAG TPA: cysteine desulfurase NifS [Porphyromonadaceae bacterium]|nr:MAG: cysteine desulfurase NifS [Bacteroidetes bacterium GWC2_46_850]HBA99449.1 cysteine desulfurase NifS [Porphyromonadaceae bacterium]HCC18219.1 cysteine desulfurase NifS [Porphyromonadaceae bacterium]